MFSPEDFDKLLKRILEQLGIDAGASKQFTAQANGGGSCNGNGKGKGNGNGNGKDNCGKGGPILLPSSALVIAGLLTGVLEVDSLLVDRNQAIEIVVVGSLRRNTELDDMLDVIGQMPFDDVLRALKER